MEIQVNNFNDDYIFSETFKPQILEHIGRFHYRDGDEETEDKLLGIDLAVNAPPLGTWSLRIRRYKWYLEYPNDITINEYMDGKLSEWYKYCSPSCPNYMYYGFCNEEETEIIDYRILDLRRISYELDMVGKIAKARTSQYLGGKLRVKEFIILSDIPSCWVLAESRA